jgi:Domain of unknown function (DUF5615)
VSVNFYMDEHVHRAITEGLRRRDVDVLTAQEDDRRNTPDDILLDRAMELNRVMFSQDRDLLIEGQRRPVEEIPFAGVIYAHQLLVTVGICVKDLELIAKTTDYEEYANRVEYLPL